MGAGSQKGPTMPDLVSEDLKEALDALEKLMPQYKIQCASSGILYQRFYDAGVRVLRKHGWAVPSDR